MIHISRGWDAIEREQQVKSAAGNRRVPILEPLAGELAAHKLRTEGSSDALVFGRTAAEPFNPETIRRNALAAWGWQEVPNKETDGPRTILAKVRDDAQQPITLHEARHTCAPCLRGVSRLGGRPCQDPCQSSSSASATSCCFGSTRFFDRHPGYRYTA